MPNEADTCRRFVAPRLQQAGWDEESHQAPPTAELDALLPSILDKAFKGEL